MQLPSKFQLGQIVNVVAGGLLLRSVPIVKVAFFVPNAPAGILGSNNETDNESGVVYTIADPFEDVGWQPLEVYAWMLELA